MAGTHQGIAVLELGNGLACAYAGMLLADRGADVVVLEPPGSDDSGRAGSAKRRQWLDRSKRSFGLALTDANGREVLERLLARSDVLLTDLDLKELAARALDESALRARHPHLVLVRNEGWGDCGPEAGEPFDDLLLQARSGLMTGEGKLRADGATPARLTSTEMTAYPTGVLLSLAVSSALMERERIGVGQEARVSEFAVALALQVGRTTDNVAADRLRMRTKAKLAAARAQHADIEGLRAARDDTVLPPGNIFYRPFRTLDGAIFVGALSKPLRDKVRQVLGSTFLYRDDPKFDPENPAYRAECVAQELRTETQMRTRTSAAWLADFEAAGVPVGEVVFPEDLSAHPQAVANSYFVRVVHPVDGEQLQPAHPVRFARSAVSEPRPAPTAGADTHELLRELATLQSRNGVRLS